MLQRLSAALVKFKEKSLAQVLQDQESWNTKQEAWNEEHEFIPFLSASSFDIKGDDTDETGKLQNWLNTCSEKGMTAYLPASLSPSALGLVLDSRHNNLRIVCDGWFKHFGDGTTSANKPPHINTGASYCIYIDSVDGLKGNIKVDGVRASKNKTTEQVHCVGLFGGKNHRVSYQFKNTQGDGLYMNQSNGNDESNPPRNIEIPVLRSDNDDYFGRNAFSVISAIGLTVGTVISNKHGGIIGTTLQPGGVDIEPNYTYQMCHDISFGKIIADTACSGFTCFGKAYSGNYNIRNVSVGQLHVGIEYWSALDALRNNNQRGAFIMAADGVSIDVLKVRAHRNYNSPRIFGVQIDAANNVTIDDLHTERVFLGARIGATRWGESGNTAKVNNCKVHLTSSIYQRLAVVGDVDGLDLKCSGFIPTVLISGSDVGLVQFVAVDGVTAEVKSTKVSVRTSRGATVNWGIMSTHSNIDRDTCFIYDSDLTAIAHGISNAARLIKTANFRKYNIAGVTPKDGADTISGTEIWGVGDVVNDTSVSGASGSYVGKVYTAAGWKMYGAIV